MGESGFVLCHVSGMAKDEGIVLPYTPNCWYCMNGFPGSTSQAEPGGIRDILFLSPQGRVAG